MSIGIDPVAYYHLNRQRDPVFPERAYRRIEFCEQLCSGHRRNGAGYCFLNIPYFTSKARLKEEISNFLVTIINLNAFIFFIAGIVALFITNRITSSFSFISEKMKQGEPGPMNEAIVWNRNDEIGELVKEYNKMVAKLDA